MGYDFFPCVAARGYVEASICKKKNQHNKTESHDKISIKFSGNADDGPRKMIKFGQCSGFWRDADIWSSKD